MDETNSIDVNFATIDVEQVKKMFEAQAIHKKSDTCPVDINQVVFEKGFDLKEAHMDII
jgi:hypothetical protein